MLSLALGLGACSPIETIRSVRGIDKNDPGPTAPFTGNLAEAEAAPYPNLASVPPPPSRATSTAERQKLAQALTADRAATAQAGSVVGGPPGSVPAAPAAAAASAKPTAAAGLAPSAKAAAAPLAPPNPQPEVPPATAAREKVASAAPTVSTAPAATDKPAAKEGRTGPRKSGEAPDPQPMDSSLQVPQVRMTPQPESPRPPLPLPRLPSVPAPIAAEPAAASIATATPQAAPPVPVLPPIEVPPGPPKPEPKRPPAPMTVATLDRLDKSQIAQVAGLYKEQPGTVKVVGFAAAPSAGADPLSVYHAALDRAQEIAKALAAAGIPANKIQTEATPATATSGAARVEIQFLP